MPNRLFRDGYLDSERIAALSPGAELCYVRMLLSADDAGRLDGRPHVLKSRLWPVDPMKSVEKVREWVSECHRQGLLKAWLWDSKPILQLLRWQKPSPAKRSRFPDPDGVYTITWHEADTRDGKKQFVSTSLPDAIAMPSVSLWEGLGMAFEEKMPTRSETETETETERISIRAGAQESPGVLPGMQGDAVGPGFKKWDRDRFVAAVKAENTDGLLTAEEETEFIEHWTQVDSKGKMKFQLEKTWGTRARMRTSLNMIFKPRREKGTGRTPESVLEKKERNYANDDRQDW